MNKALSTFFAVLLCGFAQPLFAQPFSIGNTSVSFFDSDRNRTIQTEIYYPSQNSGENVPVADGNFPVLVFGHGFLMSWDAYQNFWEALVPEGFILCFPTTESGAQPNHGAFGLDLKFIAAAMQLENLDNNSLFFEAVSSKTGLMGHSMGGGASFLAAADNANIHALINFAAAETNPSAISAAEQVTVPSLLFSGTDDCVTPQEDHQDLMYDALASDCKTQISILNGGHCYFANENFICSFGESTCNPNLSITREEQQEITMDYLKLWLDFALKDNSAALVMFNDSLAQSTRVDYRQSCMTANTAIANESLEIKIYPNPAEKVMFLEIPESLLGGTLAVYSNSGAKVLQLELKANKNQVDLTALEPGVYFLSFEIDHWQVQRKLIKLP